MAFQAEPGQIALSGQVEIARLVDLSAQRMKMNVAYDAAALKGTVTLRLAENLSDDELWALTNQVLAAQGLASIIDRSGNLIRIVKAPDAASAAVIAEAATGKF